MVFDRDEAMRNLKKQKNIEGGRIIMRARPKGGFSRPDVLKTCSRPLSP